eukprot:1149987-Pelagomonas_calceolata.AAC.3
MKRVPRTNSRHLLRKRGGRGGSREHSEPAEATPPIFKVRHPSLLNPIVRRSVMTRVWCAESMLQVS